MTDEEECVACGQFSWRCADCRKKKDQEELLDLRRTCAILEGKVAELTAERDELLNYKWMYEGLNK